MQRMSAIATKTNEFVKLVAPYDVKVLDTRKTTPNFRVCEKWAVKIGGGINHRFGLYDQILIKDNHIKSAGGIKNAIESCIQYIESNDLKMPVIVEVKNIEEFNIAKGYKIIDRILVDNFKPKDIIELLKYNSTNKIIEASGGIMESNIVEYAKTGINYVSLGDLTHHVNAVDISLKIM
jgi:nicotinate-nucleotide pyrophosphorylase (carboxylating)